MNTVLEKLTALGTEYGLKVIGAILILILGRVAAAVGRKVLRKVLRKAKTEESIVTFVGSLTYILILTFTIIATLAKFGVQTASFVAILGAGAFAVGMALQGSLANFASGVLTLIFRPYKVGDYIEGGGVAGTVKEVRLFTTTLHTPDNIKIIVPNSRIYADVIKNYSANDTRRLDLAVGIGYGSSIQKAQELLTDLMRSDERILSEPAPQVFVSELGDSSVNLIARCWAKRENFWPAKFDLTRNTKEEFDERGIEIPFHNGWCIWSHAATEAEKADVENRAAACVILCHDLSMRRTLTALLSAVRAVGRLVTSAKALPRRHAARRMRALAGCLGFSASRLSLGATLNGRPSRIIRGLMRKISLP